MKVSTMKNLLLNDRFVLLLIALNTLLVFTDGIIADDIWMEYADDLFTVIFCAEAIAKIHTFGWRTYWNNGWNRFDFVIVLLALPSLSNLFMEGDMIGTHVILSLRAMRIFKSFLLFRYIPNISNILNGIRLAVRSSIFICVAYGVFLIVFSVLTYALFGNDAPEYFGTPIMSMYSIFRLFTIEGWYEMPEAVAACGGVAMGVLARLYFALLLFVGGILGMSLVNSIFVDAMVSDNNDLVMEKLDQIEKELQNIKNK